MIKSLGFILNKLIKLINMYLDLELIISKIYLEILELNNYNYVN